MRLSFGDMIRLHLENLDGLDWAVLVLLAVELGLYAWGAVALARGWHGHEGLRRLSSAAISAGLVAVVLAVAGLAMHQLNQHWMIKEADSYYLGAAELATHQVEAFLALMFGLLIAAVGLVGGWTLEWFAERREEIVEIE